MIKNLLLLIAFLLIVTACDDTVNNKSDYDTVVDSDAEIDKDIDIETDEDIDEDIIPLDLSYNETQFEVDYASSNAPVTVSFFKGTSNDFYRYDKNGEDFTLYHYSDSIALISSFSGKLASGAVKAIIPENKVLYYTDNSVGVISEEGDKSVTFEERIYDIHYYNDQIAILTYSLADNSSLLRYYNTKMELLNEIKLPVFTENDYHPDKFNLCNDFKYLYYSDNGRVFDKEGNYKEFPFSCSGESSTGNPYPECHLYLKSFFCSDEKAYIIAKVITSYFESDEEKISIRLYTVDNSMNIETTYLSSNDDVISFTDKNYLYNKSYSFIADKVNGEDLNDKTTVYALPLIHYTSSENSFINNGGNILIADTAIYPYIEIISPEGELLYTKLFEINEKHAENIKSFTETSEKDGYAFVGNGYSLIDDSSYHGMYDIVQGKILAGDQSYSSSFSGTSHDEKGYKIINNKDGYVTTSLEKVYEDGSVKNKLKISFQNKDFQETASSVKEVEEDSAHMIEKIDDEIYLITINNGIQMTIYSENGEEESSKTWNIERFNPIRFKTLIKRNKHYLLSYNYELGYEYNCGCYLEIGSRPSDNILKLPLNSDEASSVDFVKSRDYIKVDILEKDEKIYSAQYQLNTYAMICRDEFESPEYFKRTFVFGTIDDNGTFSQEKEFDPGEYGEVTAHKPTGNFYVFFENKVEVYNSSWNMIAKINDWKYNDSLYKIDDSGNIIIISKKGGAEGKAIIKIAKYEI